MSFPGSSKVNGAANLNIVLGLVGVLVLIAALGSAYYFYDRYQKSQDEISTLVNDPQAVVQKQTEELLADIGKVVDLPEGENPTVATVNDSTKLKEQPFFSEAENGDKVLIYTEAKKAFLYRPSTKKIIEIAPVNIGEEESKTAP